METSEMLERAAGLFSFVLLIMTCITCLWTGLQNVRYHKQLHQRGASTLGRLIRIREEIDTRSSFNAISYFPTFAYEFNGIPYEVEPHGMNSSESMEVGKQIELWFLPENPQECTWRKTAGYGMHCFWWIYIPPFPCPAT